MPILKKMLAGFAAVTLATSSNASTTLYDQDFEAPLGFVNDGGDFNIFRTINQLYGNQPPGFSFGQEFTVETLLVGGNQAFGTGYRDPAGVAGQYVIGMLSSVQDDRLGLAFNVGQFDFLNLRVDISSIDLDRQGGPFVPTGTAQSVPIFRFSLYDNPTGQIGSGFGSILDSFDATGLLNLSKNTLLFSGALGGLDARASTNGNVFLQIDLLQGGYAALDNLRVVASDIKGVVDPVPEPATWALMIAGFGLVGAASRRRQRTVSLSRAVGPARVTAWSYLGRALQWPPSDQIVIGLGLDRDPA